MSVYSYKVYHGGYSNTDSRHTSYDDVFTILVTLFPCPEELFDKRN